MITKEKLEQLRGAAERLHLGEPQARWLRGLFVELVAALLGEDVEHPDVTMSGARHPAPNFVGAMPAPPVAGLSAPVMATAPPGAPGSPASPRRPASAPLSLADGARIVAERKAAAAAASSPAPAPAAEPVNGAADPAGPDFLARLERTIEAENEPQ